MTPRWRVTRWLLLVVLAVGVAVRVVLLREPDMWQDEARNGLMGLAVLRGELPLYIYGQAFMGALDAYLAAPLYLVFGPAIRTVKLLPLALSLVWMGLSVRLAWEAFGPRAALFAAAVLAVPSNFLLSWAVEARTKYHLCVVLGTLALLLALRPLGRSAHRDLLRLGVLGLILGLGFWTNFLTVVFGPAVAILALRRGVRPALPGLVLAAGAFALGSLPHWIYGLAHGTALPASGGLIGLADVARHLDATAWVAWPVLAGVPEPLRDTPVGFGLAGGVAAVAALAVAVAAWATWGGPERGRAALLALLALVAANVGAAVGTENGERIDADPKYFIPAYSVLPVLLGAGLAALPAGAGVPVLAGLLAVQAAGAATGMLQGQRPAALAILAAKRQAKADTIAALERAGVRWLYAPDAGASVLAFLSGARIVMSDPYQAGYLPDARAVDGAPRAGWWFHWQDPAFETNLAALGVRAAFRPMGPLGGAYVDFVLPPERLRELPPSTLRVTASVNATTAAYALDRDAETFWSSGAPKTGGEWLQVDLGRAEPVALIRWLPRVFQEVPSGVRLETSLDGAAWRRLVDVPDYWGPLYWSAGRPMLRVRSGRVELRVPPTPARYVRITQTGGGTFWYWTIRELFVYAADPAGTPTLPDGDGAALGRAVRAAGVRRLYADHGWSYRLIRTEPDLRVMPANLLVDTYGFTGPESEFLPLMRWEPGSGVLVEPPDAPGFVRAAETAGLGVVRADLGGLNLFTYGPPPPPPGHPVSAAELRVTASVDAASAPRAADGRQHTRWTTGRAQAAGDWLRLDLSAPRRLRAVRLWTAGPLESPRALRLDGTPDGVTWTTLPARVRTEGPLRWAGITALRDGVTTVWVDFPPVAMRGLRLTLTRGDRVHAWSVHELTVYADE